jgi:hypothetical protein
MSGSSSVKSLVFNIVPFFPKSLRLLVEFSENVPIFLKSIMETLCSLYLQL